MDDLIRRQDAIDMLAKMQGLCTSKAALIQNSKIWDQIKDMPTAQRKRGKWIKMTGMMPPEYFGHYECSECGWHLSHHDKTKENELTFCPFCGAEMRVQE